jgi:uncharacterized protein (DUF983 family)
MAIYYLCTQNHHTMGSKPPYVLSVLGNKCPRCRQGKLFKTNNPYALKNSAYMDMYEYCPVCGQRTEIEVGFYYGTSYVSYAVTVAFSVATFVAWWVLIGISLNDNRIFWWLGLNSFFLLAMQPIFMRHSRTLWLSWFVKYDPEWKTRPPQEPERIVEEQMKNW